ncbi:hypothetical protein Tco_0103857 [Tanacetum coccineum]
MGDEHLDTILATKSDEVIKSSAEDLVQSQVSPRVFRQYDNFGSDDDLLTVRYRLCRCSLPMLRSSALEVVEIVIPEVGRIDDDILLTIKDDTLRKKLLNVNLLIAKDRYH